MKMWRLPFVSVLLLAVASGADDAQPCWWENAVLYQIYPRSFKDSNGDGTGDLKGITEKVSYLKELGVTAIWTSPIFKSPMVDAGYDISDFKAIDPIFGTMEDFKELVAAVKKLDIKILLDLVPNHSSDQHEWFQKSIKKIEPYTHYYIWHDGKKDESGKTIPPNNWRSVFSGPAWHWNDERQQYYLAEFAQQQPDLNFTNPLVLKEMDDIMLFWLDTGVDGFRVDSVLYMYEDAELRNEYTAEGETSEVWEDLVHTYTHNHPKGHELMEHWADLVYKYKNDDERAFFVEAYADLNTTIGFYGEGQHSFMVPFNFQLLVNGNLSTRPHQWRELIMGWLDAMPEGATANWVIGNHDNMLIANRYGPEMVDAMNLMTSVLPGVKVVYNGEEIGMQDTFIRWEETCDPKGILLGPDHYQEASRDSARTPMQWDDSPSAGFSSNRTTWLPVNPNYWWLNVEAQKAADKSHLKVFQSIVEARKDPVLMKGDVEILVPDDDTLVVVRKLEEKAFILIINMGSEVVDYTTKSLFTPIGFDTELTVVVSSINSGLDKGFTLTKGSANLTLRPKAAVLLKTY